MKIKRFRNEVMFREAVNIENASRASAQRVFGPENAEFLLAHREPGFALLSGVVKQAAEAYLAAE